MRRYDHDDAVRRLGQHQHGVWTDEQSARAGISRAVTSRRVLAGNWKTVHPGVRALSGWNRTFAGDALAAAWSLHEGRVSNGAAAVLLSIHSAGRAQVEVTVLRGRRQPRPFVVHETRSLPPLDRAEVNHVPCTTVTRTLVDLASTWDADRLTDAIGACINEGRTSVPRLRRVAMPHMGSGKRSTATLTEVLARHDDGEPPTESALERLLFGIVAEGGYGHVKRQVPLHPLAGEPGRVDGFVQELGMILEADGRPWHTRVAHLQRDRRRDNALQAAGYVVFRFGHEEIVHDRQGVLAVLDVHLTTRGYSRNGAGLWVPADVA